MNNTKTTEERKKTGNPGTKKKPSEKWIFFRTFVIAFLIFTVVGTPVLAAKNKVEQTNPFGEENPVLEEEFDYIIDPESPFYEAFSSTKRVNVLLLGINSGLTDTIMLVSLDTKNKHVDIISIPRDTYYYRDGYNSDAEKKINAAYRKDPVNTAKAVSDVLLGIPINYYAVVDYEGIEKIVDSMGGVPMDIPFDMDYEDPYDKPPLKIHIKEGPQVLDGAESVKFLRYRHGYVEGDLGRVKAQQQFMKNAFKQCISFDLPKIAKTVFENVDSDITIGTALSLAKNAIGIEGDAIETYTMPGYADPKPPYYVYPDSEQIADLIKVIYSIGTEDGTTSGSAVSGTAVTGGAAE